jgi:hypothetical protein
MSDEGVSELLGYAILAGMVITAVVCIASGTGGVLVSATESARIAEASLAVRSFAATASNVAHANNTYFTAAEIQVPAGYELMTLDGSNDVASTTISCGGREIFAGRTGSISLRSPFRSVSYEGGAFFSNDSGIVNVIRTPAIFVASQGGDRTLYVFLTVISSNATVIAGSRPVVLDVRAESGRNISQPAGGPVTICLTSMCPDGWSAILREKGFAVGQAGNKVTATLGGITDVCIDCATLRVRAE